MTLNDLRKMIDESKHIDGSLEFVMDDIRINLEILPEASFIKVVIQYD